MHDFLKPEISKYLTKQRDCQNRWQISIIIYPNSGDVCTYRNNKLIWKPLYVLIPQWPTFVILCFICKKGTEPSRNLFSEVLLFQFLSSYFPSFKCALEICFFPERERDKYADLFPRKIREKNVFLRRKKKEQEIERTREPFSSAAIDSEKVEFRLQFVRIET